jgi:UDP-glucose 4-epimerase
MSPQGISLLGVSGFVVGGCLLKRVQDIFPEIYAIARDPFDLTQNDGVLLYFSSLDNIELLKELFPKCKTVFHLASANTPGSSALVPTIEATENLLPSLRFLECLQEYKHIPLIYLSSGGATYGTSPKKLVTEDEPLSPLSYYGAGEASIEKFILAFCQQTQGGATILSPANCYGPDQKYRNKFRIVPTIFRHCLMKVPLPIWGDGEIIRDYSLMILSIFA